MLLYFSPKITLVSKVSKTYPTRHSLFRPLPPLYGKLALISFCPFHKKIKLIPGN